MKYSILDPTGNITALVESEIDIPEQPAVAADIMKRHPDVEQVGFVRFSKARQADALRKGFTEGHKEESPEELRAEEEDKAKEYRVKAEEETEEHICAELRMAGGEFCGNASMCAAALYLMRSGEAPEERADGSDQPDVTTVLLRVSGADSPVEVRLNREPDGCYRAGICMPSISRTLVEEFTFERISGRLPVVRPEGITHILIKAGSPFFFLRNCPEKAEEAVRLWCSELSADGLGLIFLEPEDGAGDPVYRLTPLVYIPGSHTCVWENSCASGTAAAGMALARRAGHRSALTFREPGGDFSVTADPGTNELRLYGKVAFKGSLSYTLKDAGLEGI